MITLLIIAFINKIFGEQGPSEDVGVYPIFEIDTIIKTALNEVMRFNTIHFNSLCLLFDQVMRLNL